MKNNLKTLYYKDEINDDFAGTDIKTKATPENYKYIHTNPFYKFFAFIIYWIIAKPLVWLMTKISTHQKFVNKKVMKPYLKKGYFIYANHTLIPEDAYVPNIVQNKKKNYIIVGYDTVSIKGIGTLVSMLGCIPVPSSFVSAKNFLEAIKTLIKQGKSITIYPEAHIWPYYTDIRPFKDVSFTYPYQTGAPVFVFTNTYVPSRNKLRKKPKVITYVDGPFFADQTLSKPESIKKLRDEVYETMKKASQVRPQVKYKFDYQKVDE